MTMLPHLDCLIAKKIGADRYGQPIYGADAPAHVGVVKLSLGAAKTSVRADSSASRGKSEELEADARLLFPSWGSKPEPGDVLTIRVVNEVYRLKIKSVFPRLSVLGQLDHWQTDCVIAGEGE